MATVEVTPLIDVVFLLLIFFMVSTTFTRECRAGGRLAGQQSLGRPHGSAQQVISRFASTPPADYAVNGIRACCRNGRRDDACKGRCVKPSATDSDGGIERQRVVVAADAAMPGTKRWCVVLDAARAIGIDPAFAF